MLIFVACVTYLVIIMHIYMYCLYYLIIIQALYTDHLLSEGFLELVDWDFAADHQLIATIKEFV